MKNNGQENGQLYGRATKVVKLPVKNTLHSQVQWKVESAPRPDSSRNNERQEPCSKCYGEAERRGGGYMSNFSRFKDRMYKPSSPSLQGKQCAFAEAKQNMWKNEKMLSQNVLEFHVGFIACFKKDTCTSSFGYSLWFREGVLHDWIYEIKQDRKTKKWLIQERKKDIKNKTKEKYIVFEENRIRNREDQLRRKAAWALAKSD